MKIFRLFAALTLICFTLSPNTRAVVPAPDGGYPNFTTAEGQNALTDLTTGAANTALGAYSMFGTTTGSFNTAVGAGALDLNTGDQNTAVGAAALLFNTGMDNTATGAFALYFNTTGADNTAIGANALGENIVGEQNTAIGSGALLSNNAGANTAVGSGALGSDTTGGGNTALGFAAGSSTTTDSNNIFIGSQVFGADTQSNTIMIGNSNVQATYITGILGSTASGGIPVYVTTGGLLGTMTSSARFKTEIKPMGNTSEALLALKPVTFQYKKEIDPKGIPQFGLVAEDVEKVNSDLVVLDKDGKPYTVRYDAVNAMLLNEFLKEHKTVQEQGATITELKMQIQALTAGLQKVSAQLEVSKSVPQTVLNNQ